MQKKEEYEQRTLKLLRPIADKYGWEIVDVEYVKEGSNRYLRTYLDKPGGITIDDLETAGRELGDKLDEEDFISDSYILETSSPGLDRPLKKDKDFERSLGEEIEVRLYRAFKGKKEYTGILKKFDSESLTIEADGGDMEFSRSDIALARLAFEF